MITSQQQIIDGNVYYHTQTLCDICGEVIENSSVHIVVRYDFQYKSHDFHRECVSKELEFLLP